MRVLREMAQRTPDGARWFRSAGFDLFVWEGAQGEFEACQLADHAHGREQVYLWSRSSGSRLSEVDDERSPGGHPRAALLQTRETVDVSTLLQRFDRDSQAIDERVRSFILARLRADCLPTSD